MKSYEEPRMVVVRLMNNDIVATDMPVSNEAPDLTQPPTSGGPGVCDFQTGVGCTPANGAK